ncbi:WG repeat-containing protein [Bordetella genomosp. 1]|uniref:WG repeat-containing protein n=1 Tax=Bordetella genomosp. 1 TaxID=1395607 RepID=A0ABX4EZ45_9BORD|nr:WG repeat-containing protein [Bordetella genomosp. 1]OZI65016.1 hypothetical protein CAL27_08020 [Bordetella genomosp. 1]
MSKFSSPLRLTLLALALQGFGSGAAAEMVGLPNCAAPADYVADDPMPASHVNACIRNLSERRAAVLLPSALEEIERVPTDESLGRHAWGFLDENGRLAIVPRFEEARDFRNGRAAVKRRGKWGFIDTRGKFAVPARFDAVEDFVSSGLALVHEKGVRKLIDRDGRQVGAAFDHTVQEVMLRDGLPAQVNVIYHQELRRDDGVRQYGDSAIQLHKTLGPGLIVGSNEEGRYGVLEDEGLDWKIPPTYHEIEVTDGAPLALAVAEEEVVLIDRKGTEIGRGRGFERIHRIDRSDFWSAQLPEYKGWVVIDGEGRERVTLKEKDAQQTAVQGAFLIYPDGDVLKALVPGQESALTLGAKGSLEVADEIDGYVVFRDTASGRYSLLTPKGTWMHGDQAPAWMTELGHAEVRAGRLWLRDGGQRLLNIVDADGHLLMDEATMKASADVLLVKLPFSDPQAPVAMSRASHCQCESGPALLLADGTLVTDPSWHEVNVLEPDDDYGPPAAPVAADQVRFAATTDAGVVLLDARGKPMSLPPQKHIGLFDHGYAYALQDDQVQLIDRDGKIHALPENFALEPIGAGMARYVRDAAAAARWGLYDLRAGQEVMSPQLAWVRPFVDGKAVAALAPGRVGVIDAQGNWHIPADYAGIERVNGGLWLVQQAQDTPVDPDAEDAEPPLVKLVDAEGKDVLGWQPGLGASERQDDGLIVLHAGSQRWLVGADGTEPIALGNGYYTRAGRWMQISRQPEFGYLDAQGGWQLRTETPGTPFSGQPARAVMPLGYANEPRLIDGAGKTVATLPPGDWQASADGKWLINQRLDDDGEPEIQYADANGKVLHTLEGYGTTPSEDVVVLKDRDNLARAVALKPGTPVPPVAYRYLGERHDGLTLANAGDSVGYLDARGIFAIAPAYVAASPFSGQRAVVSTDAQSMLIDTQGRVLARAGLQCGIRVLYGATGERLWPLTLPASCQP